MSNSRKLANATAAAVFFAAALVITVPARQDVNPSDTAAYYNAKCVACHGKKAEKKFDPSIPEDQMVDIVLNGKAAAKPPKMPGYGAKGVSSDQARALIGYMKQLKAGQ